jgi:hypothetical protein
MEAAYKFLAGLGEVILLLGALALLIVAASTII